MKKIITRHNYLFGKGESSKKHRRYYAQFVNDAIKQKVLSVWSIKELKQAYAKDEHFNNLSMAQWDLFGGFIWKRVRGEEIAVLRPRSTEDILPVDYKLLKEAGEGISNSALVCIYKEAARQLIGT